MFTHSSSLTFVDQRKGNISKILNVTMETEVEYKWNSNFESIKKKGNHRKFVEEIFTWTVKPPHCLTQKCQKLSQLPSSWTLASKITLDESHQ
jgi:hypothetical protein